MRGSILISGAGVAGLALAHWVHRYGYAVTVVERAPGLRTGGQAIDVRGTARQVLERMGVMADVRAHHTGTHGVRYVDARGRRRAELGGDAFGDSGGIVAEIEILRADMVRILHAAAGDGVEYLFDDVITGLAEAADGVRVSFARAAPRTFDLVVGADGVRSGVRALAFGDESRFVRDLGYYSALFPARTAQRLDGWELMFNAPAGNGVGGRVVMVYPVGDTGEVRAMLSFVSPPLTWDRRDPDAVKRLLERAFAGVGWQVPDLLAQLRRADDVYFFRAGEVRMDSWSTGRAVLLGDAAFGGSVGMGTSMALVGAYVLAGELAASGGDHRAALAAYEHRLRDYVTANMQRPPGGTSGFAPATATAIWLRNQFMRLLPHLPGRDRMMGGIQQGANAIALKDYAA